MAFEAIEETGWLWPGTTGTIEEAAEALGISERTAKRYWTFARAWLHEEINSHQSR